MRSFVIIGILISGLLACNESKKDQDPIMKLNAKEVLEKFGHRAFSYGGYRQQSREIPPSIEEVKEDLLILNALGCHLIRTYQTQMYGQEKVLFKAISELKQEDEDFNMYVMLGAWIQSENAWQSNPNPYAEDTITNIAEINAAIEYAKSYPDIVKIIAVGNEAMVHWAAGYRVVPSIILKYVNQLKALRTSGDIDSSIWITSSDNFASWGGGPSEYHNEDLKALIKAVDFVSLHTYPFHDTHYNPQYWNAVINDTSIDDEAKIEVAIDSAISYAKNQYQSTKAYVESISPNKLCHIGETGWASQDVTITGPEGSRAADEFKQALYYQKMRAWTKKEGIACFYFQIFDEPWKDDQNVGGSENHFGLITVDGKVKYGLWQEFDDAKLDSLKRIKALRKTYEGSKDSIQLHTLYFN